MLFNYLNDRADSWVEIEDGNRSSADQCAGTRHSTVRDISKDCQGAISFTLIVFVAVKFMHIFHLARISNLMEPMHI